jgi:hypothetical protein
MNIYLVVIPYSTFKYRESRNTMMQTFIMISVWLLLDGMSLAANPTIIFQFTVVF